MAERQLPPAPGPDWFENPGRQPGNTRGRRVDVLLWHGEPRKDYRDPMTMPGWGADKARWSIEGSPFDIAWYKRLG